MSAFDMKINLGRTAIASPPPEAVKAGEAENALDVILTVVQVLPFGNPGQPPVAAALGNIKFTLGRDQALEFGKTLVQTAEELPPESKLEIANDLGMAERMGEDFSKFRNGS